MSRFLLQKLFQIALIGLLLTPFCFFIRPRYRYASILVAILLLVVPLHPVYISMFLTGNDYGKLFRPLLYKKKALAKVMPSVAESRQWLKTQTEITWTLKSRDGLLLENRFLPSATNKDAPIVIVIHPFKMPPDYLSGLLHYYHKHLGYHVIIPALRAHKPSDGTFITFGIKESDDMLQLIQHARMQLGSEPPIFLHGLSMGGAIALMVASDPQLPSQVKGVISDSSFSSLKELIDYSTSKYLFAHYSHILWPYLNYMAHRQIGIALEDAAPSKRLAQANLPILLLHSKKDSLIPYAQAEELYKNTSHPASQLIPLNNSVHPLGWYQETQFYQAEVKSFFDNVLENHA